MPIIDECDAVSIVSRFVRAPLTEIARVAALRCRQTHSSLEVDVDSEGATKDAIA